MLTTISRVDNVRLPKCHLSDVKAGEFVIFRTATLHGNNLYLVSMAKEKNCLTPHGDLITCIKVHNGALGHFSSNSEVYKISAHIRWQMYEEKSKCP